MPKRLQQRSTVKRVTQSLHLRDLVGPTVSPLAHLCRHRLLVRLRGTLMRELAPGIDLNRRSRRMCPHQSCTKTIQG